MDFSAAGVRASGGCDSAKLKVLSAKLWDPDCIGMGVLFWIPIFAGMTRVALWAFGRNDMLELFLKGFVI